MAQLHYKCTTPYEKANKTFVGIGTEVLIHDFLSLSEDERLNYVASDDAAYSKHFGEIGRTYTDDTPTDNELKEPESVVKAKNIKKASK